MHFTTQMVVIAIVTVKMVLRTKIIVLVVITIGQIQVRFLVMTVILMYLYRLNSDCQKAMHLATATISSIGQKYLNHLK